MKCDWPECSQEISKEPGTVVYRDIDLHGKYLTFCCYLCKIRFLYKNKKEKSFES